MAFGEHSCTRRDLLGAAVAVPVVGVLRDVPSPGSGAPQDERGRDEREGEENPRRTAFLLALAVVTKTEARMNAFARRTGGRKRPFEAQCRVDERFSDHATAYNRAVEALILTPAPDLRALAAKLAIAVGEQVWELPTGEACMARLREDAEALAAACG